MGNEEGTDISISMIALPTHVSFFFEICDDLTLIDNNFHEAIFPANCQNGHGFCHLNRRSFWTFLRLLIYQHFRNSLQDYEFHKSETYAKTKREKIV